MIDKKESIVKQLTQKPWESAQAKVDNLHEGKTFNLHVGKLGLRYIMVVSTIMFCLFIVTYSDRMVYDDWVRMPEPFLLWINTLILFISSFVFIRIQLAAKKNQFEKARRDLILIGILALAFLIGQLLVWQNLVDAGYYVSGSPGPDATFGGGGGGGALSSGACTHVTSGSLYVTYCALIRLILVRGISPSILLS